MKATLTDSSISTTHTFSIQHEGQNYIATVWLDEKGRFFDDRICPLNSEGEEGEELGYEGEEGQIREDILNYLDSAWESLVETQDSPHK